MLLLKLLKGRNFIISLAKYTISRALQSIYHSSKQPFCPSRLQFTGTGSKMNRKNFDELGPQRKRQRIQDLRRNQENGANQNNFQQRNVNADEEYQP